MKNLLSIITAICLFVALPAEAQIKDATEQSKRLARTQFHVTKTFKGEVVKMLYQGTNSYGGVLNGFVFRRSDDKLLLVDVPVNSGHKVGPLLSTNEEMEITVTGDELLLEEIFSKRLALRKIEVQLKEQISGLANIAGVISSKGSFSIENTPEVRRSRFLYASNEPVINAKVLQRIRLENREGILVLENGDSLIFNKSEGLEEFWDQQYISYLRPKDKNPYAFYRNPQVFSMDSRRALPLYSIVTGRQNKRKPSAHSTSPFLESTEVQYLSFVNDPAGYVNGMTVRNAQDQIDTFLFNRSSAKAFQQLIETAGNQSIQIHFQKFPSMNFMRAMSFKNQTISGKDRESFLGRKEEYLTEKINFTGKVSEIQYLEDQTIPWNGEKLITPFRNIIVEDSIFIRVTEVVALSMAKQLEAGTEISFDGWRRKESPEEVNEKGYTCVIPHKITINGVTFTNSSMISNTL